MRQINFVEAIVMNEIDGKPHFLFLKDRGYRWVPLNIEEDEGTESEAKGELEMVLKGMKITQLEQVPNTEYRKEGGYYSKKLRDDVFLNLLVYAIKTDVQVIPEVDNEKFLECKWLNYDDAIRVLRDSPQQEIFKTICGMAGIYNIGLS